MEQLVLYVDKYYIIGARCSDGICRAIQLPNGEDRIWLYFYEDVTHNEVTYGKQYEPPCLNLDLHYYGDIFEDICDSRKMFTQYDHQSELRNIFSVSGLFDHLKNPFKEKDNINSYISFSQNIGPAARSIFIEELEEAGFSVKLRVAWPEQLALESLQRKSRLDLSGDLLVLNALGDNMYFSTYRFSDDLYVRMNDDCLPGMGMDMRVRALVEDVVEKANWNDSYLKTKEEKEYERQRLKRLFGTEWIQRLDATRQGRPLCIGNFYFANAKFNTLSVTIQSSDIDRRTDAVVNDIVREVSRTISKYSIKNIVMLGDTFTNSMFEQAIRGKLIVNNKAVLRIPTSSLYEILGVYPIIDEVQFSSIEKTFVKDADAERIRIKNTIREEEEQKNAELELKRKEEEEKARTAAEKWYRTEMQSAYEYEGKQEYQKMLDACEQALKHKPGDEEAEKKKNDAIGYLKKEELSSKQYTDSITKAKEYYSNSRYQEALALSEVALNFRPDSAEASRIKSDALTALNRASRIQDFITSANVYLKQRMYESAEKELNKILNLDSQNEDALRLKEQLAERKSFIDGLSAQFSKAEKEEDMEVLQFLYEKIKDTDSSLEKSWLNRINTVKRLIESKQKTLVQLSKIREQIDSAEFNDDWEQVVYLCKKSLAINKEQKDINEKLVRAQRNVEKIKEKRDYQQRIVLIQSHISDGKLSDAKKTITEFQEQYPDKQTICKKFLGAIFKAEEALEMELRKKKAESTPKETESKKNKKKETNGNNKQTKFDDEFFNDSKTTPTLETSRKKDDTNQHPIIQNNKGTGDDFFDNSEPQTKDRKKISINDFNF